jgi:hypothetical protein
MKFHSGTLACAAALSSNHRARSRDGCKNPSPTRRQTCAQQVRAQEGCCAHVVCKIEREKKERDVRTLVAARHQTQRRARSQAARLHPARSEKDRGIAEASAERSTRRKASPYRSALSMLTFYINRGGKTLPKTQGERLERPKGALKRQFHRKS